MVKPLDCDLHKIVSVSDLTILIQFCRVVLRENIHQCVAKRDVIERLTFDAEFAPSFHAIGKQSYVKYTVTERGQCSKFTYF